MLIGELARRTGVGRDTIRYYEKQGLLQAPERLDNQYKIYREDDEKRLRYIGEMKTLGFTLRAIKGQMEMFSGAPVTCGAVGPEVQGRIEEIDRKIAALEAQKARLAKFFKLCTGAGAESTCRPVAQLLG